MGAKIVGEAYNVKVGDPVMKSIFVKLAENASQDLCAWPSIATIARQTEYAPSTVKRALRKLEAHGFVQKVRRKRCGDHGGWTSSKYFLHFRKPSTGSQELGPEKASAQPAMSQGLVEGRLPITLTEPVVKAYPRFTTPEMNRRIETLKVLVGENVFRAYFFGTSFLEPTNGQPITIVFSRKIDLRAAEEKYRNKVTDVFGSDVRLKLSKNYNPPEWSVYI